MNRIVFQQTRIQVKLDIETDQDDLIAQLLQGATVLIELITALLLVISWPFWMIGQCFRLTGKWVRRVSWQVSWWVTDQLDLLRFIGKVISIHLVSYGYGLGLCR